METDLEIAALRQISKAMQSLDRKTQGRVADWTYDRYHLWMEEELLEPPQDDSQDPAS